MRRSENYFAHVSLALVLTVGILITFQIYTLREPARIAADKQADHEHAVEAGRDLFQANCVACHGENGEGVSGPALNSREFLTGTSDGAISNLARSGIPGTSMPAWGQAFGGPFTDEQITQIVTFIRAWEPTAPEIVAATSAPDPVRGATIFSQTCAICHGEDGHGTDNAPAINDLERLNRLDNAWYRNTISHGRPASGMPTWGTVLSPQQIDDLVALISAWRDGETVTAVFPLSTYLVNALYAIRDFDTVDAQYYLTKSLAVADEEQKTEINAIIALVQDNQLFDAESRVATLLPPEQMGQALFTTNCAACHGADGTGETAPNLHNNTFVQSQSDDALVDFILAGRSGTGMKGFEGILSRDELANLVLLLNSWQQ